MSGFNAKRDAAIANEVHADRTLMCTANGCPNRWSVDAGNGRLCSAHAWVEQHHWPQVTQEQLDAETDRALRAAARGPKQAPRRLSREEKVEILGRLREVANRIRGGDGTSWARSIVERSRSGVRVTPAALQMAQDALRARPQLPEED